jgi:hypothetical protein
VRSCFRAPEEQSLITCAAASEQMRISMWTTKMHRQETCIGLTGNNLYGVRAHEVEASLHLSTLSSAVQRQDTCTPQSGHTHSSGSASAQQNQCSCVVASEHQHSSVGARVQQCRDMCTGRSETLRSSRGTLRTFTPEQHLHSNSGNPSGQVSRTDRTLAYHWQVICSAASLKLLRSDGAPGLRW